jgi:hypothetical protein
MKEKTEVCPFRVGDKVRFTPSSRTSGLYQDIARFGVRPGDERVVEEIREGVYLYFAGGQGGWPWNEFTKA